MDDVLFLDMPATGAGGEDKSWSGWRQQNKVLYGSWAPHRAGRTEYGVTNDDVENVEQQSEHVLAAMELLIQRFARGGFVKVCPGSWIPKDTQTEQCVQEPQGALFCCSCMLRYTCLLLTWSRLLLEGLFSYPADPAFCLWPSNICFELV